MALPFNITNLVARAQLPNRIIDDRLVLADKEFGIDDKFLAEDMVDYYKDAPAIIEPRPGSENISGIYNPNLLPLNFNNDNDRGNMFEDRSPDLVDINDDMYRFDEDRFNLGPVDTIDKKKGIMEILGMLPTPLNIARKGIDFFKDYREKKEIEKQREIEAAKILEQMRQERIKNEQIAKEKEEQAQRDAVENMRQRNEREGRGGYQSNFAQDRDFMEGPQGDGDGGNNGGGSPGSSGPGGSDSMGSFAYGGQVRRNYFNGGIVSLRGKI